jgi:ABC-type uncharacterized transport system auxiliary subunit
MALDGHTMKRLAVGMALALMLAACTSAPTPEQPAEADWAPCAGYRFHENEKSYARCVKHVATLAAA